MYCSAISAISETVDAEIEITVYATFRRQVTARRRRITLGIIDRKVTVVQSRQFNQHVYARYPGGFFLPFSCNFLALRLILAPGPNTGRWKAQIVSNDYPAACVRALHMRASHVRHSQILRHFPYNWTARRGKLLAWIRRDVSRGDVAHVLLISE